MLYRNWHLIGTEPAHSTPNSFSDILNLDILYDMK